ncbi:MAG: CDP-alcohol phosphatidyltransferase family protein [Sedimentisphaerales bacterium]|nr:CDP-alcohol phosphatidyltransferase family protein [Sedimentisphaerales bacterium]
MTDKIHFAQREALLSRFIGHSIQRLRRLVAGVLIRLRIGPTTLTVCGLPATVAAGGFLAVGGGDHTLTARWSALAFLLLAAAFDMLDGTVARSTGRMTKLGAFLDSCLDRISDGIIFTALAWYYFTRPGNTQHLWLALAAMISLLNAELISYLKARAENFIPSCAVGYWQRGERLAAVMIGLAVGHTGTVMVMLAMLPALTVWRRLTFSLRQLHRLDNGKPLLDPGAKPAGLMRLALWRYRRGHPAYDFVTAVNIAAIVIIDVTRW